MMIDFALAAERDRGMSARDAIFEACLLRFRPIMMTTMAALLGALPLASAPATAPSCAGRSASRSSAGSSVSQVLTLYTTPVVYLYLDRFRLWSQLRQRACGRRTRRAAARLDQPCATALLSD